MDVLLVIDMQEDLLLGDTKHDIAGVAERIDQVAGRVRAEGGRVVFVQHDGEPGGPFAPATKGWEILSTIRRESGDHVVRKCLNDAFRGTSLEAHLHSVGADRLLVTGWATDLCVDATVRSAAALGFKVVVISDCHTVSDRPHLGAEGVIKHHHWVWRNLISPQPVDIYRESLI